MLKTQSSNVCEKGAMLFLDNNSCDYLQRDKFSGILHHVLFLNEHNLIKKLSNKPFSFILAILYVFYKIE